MKLILKLLLSIFLLFINIKIATAYEIGVLEVTKEAVTPFSEKLAGNRVVPIQTLNLSTINVHDTPVLILYQYFGINSNVYNTLSAYVSDGGKLILITPFSSAEEPTFKRLAQLVGVTVEKFRTLPEKTEINWVEKTLSDNYINLGSKIAQVILSPDTSHLAVFGDIERHESAISLNKKGSVISWVSTLQGNSAFNEKSLTYLLAELFPQKVSSQKSPFLPQIFNDNDGIKSLKKKRKYVENYQDNIINYSKNISIIQQNIALSEINQLWAEYYYRTNDSRAYEKYLKLAEKNILTGVSALNDLAPAENRGIWFDRGTIVDIKSRQEMSKYFDKLQKAGINTVYFETFNAGFTIYPSRIGSQSPLVKGRDPLAWAVTEAHKRGMKIQAWLWIFAVGNDRHNKLIDKPMNYVGPVLEKNQRWALLGPDANFRPKNQPEFWLDPSNNEATTFILNLANEVVSTYNVDGIQLDYIRYPFQRSDNLMGFNHNSMEQYASKTGEKLFVDNYQTNLMWNKWKENNINNFVHKISNNLKHRKPNLKISASVFAKSQTNRLNSIQQNWEYWIKEQDVDSLTPMSYSSNLEALDTNLFYLRPQIGAGLIYPGIALKHVNDTALGEQVSTIREKGYMGVSLFAVAQLDEEKISFMNNFLFSQKATDPTYSLIYSAKLFLNDYQKMLNIIADTNYDLTQNQRKCLNDMLISTNNALYDLNNSQLNLAINIIDELEKQNDSFFKSFSTYNKSRKQTAKSYLKRASNLLKIATKK